MAAPASWRSEEHLRQSLQTGVQVTPVPFSGAGPKAKGLGSVVPRQVLPPSGVTQSERPPALWMLLQLVGPSPTPTRVVSGRPDPRFLHLCPWLLEAGWFSWDPRFGAESGNMWCRAALPSLAHGPPSRSLQPPPRAALRGHCHRTQAARAGDGSAILARLPLTGPGSLPRSSLSSTCRQWGPCCSTWPS